MTFADLAGVGTISPDGRASFYIDDEDDIAAEKAAAAGATNTSASVWLSSPCARPRSANNAVTIAPELKQLSARAPVRPSTAIGVRRPSTAVGVRRPTPPPQHFEGAAAVEEREPTPVPGGDSSSGVVVSPVQSGELVVFHRRRRAKRAPRPCSAISLRDEAAATKVVVSPRVTALMREYGATEQGGTLMSCAAKSRSMRVCMEDVIADELANFRTVVAEREMVPDDADVCATSTRSETTDLKELKSERLLMQRLGFVEHVDALDKRIQFHESRRKRELAQRQSDQRDRRMRLLVAQHEQRRAALTKELAEKRVAAVAEQQHSLHKLAQVHSVERDEFVDRVIRRATGTDVTTTACACKCAYLCTHNMTSSYKLRKQNPLVVKYRAAAKKLRKNKRQAEAMEFEEKAAVIDKREQVAWTKRVQQTALRTQLPLLSRAWPP